jgi:CheY-like chemotaxis protein
MRKAVKILPYSHKKSILIVDDEKDLLYILQEQLSTWYRVDRVDAFTDPHEAIRHAESKSRDLNYYDVILSDIRMPGMDGFEFIRVMKRKFPRTKRILMTAFMLMKEEFERKRLDIPADDIIVKPFAMTQLHITVNSLFDTSLSNADHDDVH